MKTDTPESAHARQQVANELGLYVYMLVDPQTGVPFYVGKGRGERFAQHGQEAMLSEVETERDEANEKIAQIRAVREAGFEPEIWIVRHGMKSDVEYTSVEAACIDLLRAMPVRLKTDDEVRIPEGHREQLANARRESSRRHGIMLLQDLYAEKLAPVLTTETPLLTITLSSWVETPQGEEMPGGYLRYGYGYKHEWLTRSERIKNYRQIGESAAGWRKYTPWGVKRRGIEYAVVLHRGVTRALLRILPDSWESYGAGSSRRSAFAFEVIDSGELFDQTIGPYGHRLPKPSAQTQYYWPLS